MNSTQWENFAADWFRKRGNTVDNLNKISKFVPADLEVMNKDGYCYQIEVKQRCCFSYTYKDTMLEAQKYNYLYENEGYYLCIFEDGAYLIDCRKQIPVRSGVAMCPRTTSFQNRDKVEKQVVYFDIKKQGTKIW